MDIIVRGTGAHNKANHALPKRDVVNLIWCIDSMLIHGSSAESLEEREISHDTLAYSADNQLLINMLRSYVADLDGLLSVLYKADEHCQIPETPPK